MKIKSFTLIELMAVVSIIVILAGIVVYGINDWKDDANLKKIIAYSNEIKSKLGFSLIAEWKMDEGGSNTDIYDSGRLGITGKVEGVLDQVVNCPEGDKCIQSKSAKIHFYEPVPVLKFKTICFWIKSVNTTSEILYNANDFKIYSNNGVVTFDVYSANDTFISVPFTGTTINDNKWHFICGSINNDSVFYGIFDDGIKIIKSVNATSFGRMSLNNMCLGCDVNSEFYLDDLVFFEETIEKSSVASNEINKPSNLSLTFSNIGAGAANASIFFMHGGENCNIALNCVEEGTSNFTGTITKTKITNTTSETTSTYHISNLLGNKKYICTANVSNSVGSISVSNNFTTIAPINGTCGTANKTYAYNITSYGTDTFCSSGIASPTSPAFPAQGESITWTCVGSNGGTNASCTAKRNAPVNGACGTANKTYAYNVISYGTDTFCSSGVASPISPAFPTQGGSTTWTCGGLNGGTSTSCTATRSLAPVNGTCGTAKKTYAYSTSGYGTDTFCSSGVVSPVSPAFPVQGGSTTWTCNGKNGGTNASCTANREGVLGFTKRTPITISNSGSALTNYQIKLGIPFFSGMQPNLNDVRFTSSNGSTLLGHWAENIYRTNIFNNGFESGNGGDAYLWNESGQTSRASDKSYLGSYSLKTTPTYAQASIITDWISVQPNTQYILSGRIYKESGYPGNAYIDFNDGTGNGGNFADCNAFALTSNTWYMASCSITTGATTTGVKIRAVLDGPITSNTKSVWFDDISLDRNVSGNFWVKVPSIPTGNSTIYLYYGNSSAISASNGDNTFEFFDDFDGTAINTTKWNIVNSTGFSVSNGQLRGTNTTGRLTSKATFNPGVVLDIKNYRTGTLPANGYGIGGFWLSTSNGMGFLDHPGNLYYRNDGTWVNQGKEAPGNVWRKSSIAVPNSTQTILNTTNYSSGATIWNPGTLSNAVSSEPISLGQRQDALYTNQSYDAYWDWILARKYASVEPTVPSQFSPKNLFEPILSTNASSYTIVQGPNTCNGAAPSLTNSTGTYYSSPDSLQMYARASCFSSPYCGSSFYANQAVYLIPGNYNLNFQARGSAALYSICSSQNSYNKVYLNNELLWSDSLAGTGCTWYTHEWRKISIPFTISTEGDYNIKFYNEATDCSESYFWIDDITIEPTETFSLVNGQHTSQQCSDAGGEVVQGETSSIFQCRFNASSCPSGWTQYKNYSTAKSGSMTGGSSCSYGCCSGSSNTISSSGWAWGDVGSTPIGPNNICTSFDACWTTSDCGCCARNGEDHLMPQIRTQIGCY